MTSELEICADCDSPAVYFYLYKGCVTPTCKKHKSSWKEKISEKEVSKYPINRVKNSDDHDSYRDTFLAAQLLKNGFTSEQVDKIFEALEKSCKYCWQEARCVCMRAD